MELSSNMKLFIREHETDRLDKLLLSASRYPNIDVPFAVEQIQARRHVKGKLPLWFEHDDLIYPSVISSEQCSSEFSARYKQRLVAGNTCCDLTGGLGVDSYYLSQVVEKHIYVERFSKYCEAAIHNFGILHANNIQVIQGDVRDNVHQLFADTFYIDPARRDESNKRVFALADCEPDVLQLKPILLDHSKRLIIKVSPMADIEETLRLLPEAREVHVVAVRNECKELLFVLEGNSPFPDCGKVKIFTVNLSSAEEDKQAFSFLLEEEKIASPELTEEVEEYLYEANAALMKSGAFKIISRRLSVKKLHYHSHLYTSKELRADFPGRKFKVIKTYGFSGRILKELSKELPKANITVRNFPLTVSELRKRSHIAEGGDSYLFATTLADDQKVLIQTVKVCE